VAHDRLVWLYEEASYNTGKSNQTGWIKRLPAFADARAPITDIKFGPKHLGLQLCVCTANGEVRIYECADILSSNVWTMASTDFKLNMLSCNSCSWSTCLNLPVLLALGGDDLATGVNNQSKLAIYELNDSIR
jgi:nucleoporin SEH1